MMKKTQKNSYASKVSKSKYRSQSLEEDSKKHDEPENAELLLQQSHLESVEETPSRNVDHVTIDEVPHVHHVQQSLHDGDDGGGGQNQMIQSPIPGYINYNYVPPPNIYSQGSPPLPLAGPLQLVYLQPTAQGISIIPFQATGYPTFSPCSPLGFPAHPHHPVVVQSPQSYLPPPEFQVNYENGMTSQVPNMYPYPPNIQPVAAPGPFPPQPPSYHYNTPPQPASSSSSEFVQGSREQPQLSNSSLTYRSHKLFRPWEDKMPSDFVEENVQNLPLRDAEPSFVEDDFPSLQSGLSKMNIK